MENLYEDLINLDFVRESSVWNTESIKELIENNKFKTNRNFKFDEMYDIDSAKRVYLFYKSHFHLIGYNPFSFTTEELTKEQKVKFLHDTI